MEEALRVREHSLPGLLPKTCRDSVYRVNALKRKACGLSTHAFRDPDRDIRGMNNWGEVAINPLIVAEDRG